MSDITRSTLLPPYLEDSQAWSDLTDAIDTVFGPRIDDPSNWLARLRDTWILSTPTENSLKETSQLIENVDFEEIERNVLIRQANMLGFDLQDSDTLTDAQYQQVVRSLAQYWYGKGTYQLQNFLGFVLDSVFTLTNLWSTQGPTYDTYGPFVPEGDPSIGTPVWESGTWFPTTHVQAEVDLNEDSGGVFNSQEAIPRLIKLFYSIANYNLVLYAVILSLRVWIHSVDETGIGRIVTASPWEEIEEVIETY